MEPYVYHEYPKCLYDANGNTMVVDNREEEDSSIQMGWMEAAKYFNHPVGVINEVIDKVVEVVETVVDVMDVVGSVVDLVVGEEEEEKKPEGGN